MKAVLTCRHAVDFYLCVTLAQMGLRATAENFKNHQSCISLQFPESFNQQLERPAYVLKGKTAKYTLHQCLRKTSNILK